MRGPSISDVESTDWLCRLEDPSRAWARPIGNVAQQEGLRQELVCLGSARFVCCLPIFDPCIRKNWLVSPDRLEESG